MMTFSPAVLQRFTKRLPLTGFLLLYCFYLSMSAQNELPVPAMPHDIGITSVFSDTTIQKDSTLSIIIRVQNNGRYVEEAIITVTDSASGDTIEQWYPLFAPQSSDSTILFWNTKDEKRGFHTVRVQSKIARDDFPENNEISHHVQILP